MEDRGKRLLLHRFISQNMVGLFKEPAALETGRKMLDNEAHSALLPPFESFTDIHEDDRSRHFFEVQILYV